MCSYSFALRACSSVSFSSETAGQNHMTAKVYVLIFIYFRNLILWKDCLNPSSTRILCCCWVAAKQHCLEERCLGQFAHVVRVCCASDVAVLRFKLCDHKKVMMINKLCPGLISISKAKSQKLIIYL